jgi:pantothenate kinase
MIESGEPLYLTEADGSHWNPRRQDSSQSRFVIGLAGIPASGKTTLAQSICKHINNIHRAQTGSIATTDIATVVGLDGWHLTRAQLSAMDDPKLAFDRRGAHCAAVGYG